MMARVDAYGSDSLRIKRVATRTIGTYFLVTEADVLSMEDYTALRGLDAEMLAPWRKRVVETDFFDHPHKWFPASRSFRIHVVHPEARSEWGTIGRQLQPSGHYGSLGIAG